jgi:predicted enzyme related to lactoylglutathione lyase
MSTRFAWASIWSHDLNNLLPFYRDVLGLKVTMETPGFVVVGTDSEEEPGLGIGTHSEVKGKASDPYRHMVGLATDNLDGDYARLTAAGVEFIEGPTDYGGGMRMATLKDPEGNIVQLSQRP